MTPQRINYGIRLSPLASDNPNNLRYPMVLCSIRELLTSTPDALVTMGLTQTDRDNYPNIYDYIHKCAHDATVVTLIYDNEEKWAEGVDTGIVYGHINAQYCQEVPGLRALQEDMRLFRVAPPESPLDPIEFEPVPKP